MPAPTNSSELRQFLDMVNQLGKFSSKLPETSQPLCALLSSKNAWVRGDQQETALNLVNKQLTTLTVRSLCDPTADASSFGFGAVLMEKNLCGWSPVAYNTKGLTETECRYVQTEKEGLAATWVCVKDLQITYWERSL